MDLITTEYITGKNFEMLGYVKGSTVQSTHAGKDFAASFKTLVGGELKGYTQMLDDARKEAVARMVADAQSMGADAVIGLRFASASVMQGAAEIIAYGTAVKYV